MKLETIKAQNFRNYAVLEADGFGQTNVVIGANGSGKTNFLEAIYLLSSASPIRSVGHPELIRWGAKYYYLTGNFDGHDIALGYSASKRVLKFDEEPIHKDALKVRNPVIVFEPEDIGTVNGSPDTKRGFLDTFLSMADIRYAYALNRYQKALRQRNAQLKIAPKDAPVWNRELAANGAVLVRMRIEFIRGLNRKTQAIFGDLYGTEIELKYLNNFKIQGSIEECLTESLESSFKADSLKRYTTKGPHRDAYEIYVLNAGERRIASGAFASQGQLRSLSLSMKLGATEYIESVSGNGPILLLDDVLLEIDEAKRETIFRFLSSKYQTFFTATSLEVLGRLAGSAVVYRASGGVLTKA